MDALPRLQVLCEEASASRIARGLADARALVAEEQDAMELVLARHVSCRGGPGDAVHGILGSGGKRIRALCLCLSARLGGRASTEVVVDLAVAAEMIHAATLLHDDIIDEAPTRRGRAAAHVRLGTTAAVLGGDWLFAEALRRAHRSRDGQILTELLDVVQGMVNAEALQAQRSNGNLCATLSDYDVIATGKTAGLFAWSVHAGARAGGLDDLACASLRRFGHDLGLAFQIIDDVLDIEGKREETGKALLGDLRDGRPCYPLILGAQENPRVGALLASLKGCSHMADGQPESLLCGLLDELVAVLRKTNAAQRSRRVAERYIDAAIEQLSGLPAGSARDALELFALTTLKRRG